MGTGNKNGNPAIDNILDELKNKGAPAPKVSGGSIDDILTEMGMGKKPAKRFTGTTIPPAPSSRTEQPEEPAPQTSGAGQSASPQKAAPQGGHPAQPAKPQPQQAAPQGGRPAQPAKPQPQQAAPQGGHPAQPAKPQPQQAAPQGGRPAQPAKPQPQQAPPQGGRPAQPAKPQQGGRSASTSSADTTQIIYIDQTKKKNRPADDEPTDTTPKKAKTGTMIWDIELERTTQMPRMGKAAALDYVDSDKFVGDSELSRWFEGNNEIYISKKDQRKAEKEERKRLAAERKEEKRRQKMGYTQDEPEDFGLEPPQDYQEPFSDEESFEESYRDSVSDGYFAEEFPVPAPVKAVPPTPAKAAVQPVPPAPAKPAPKPADLYDGSVTERTFAASMAGNAAAPTNDDRIKARASAFDQPLTSHAKPATPPVGTDDGFIPANYISQITAKVTGKEKVVFEPPEHDTRSFELGRDGNGEEPTRVPTAAYTQEFDTGEGSPPETENKSLFVDEMVDDRFRQFFSETVIMDRPEVEQDTKARRKRKKSRTAILTGEFTKLAELAEQAEQADALAREDDEFEDYDRPQDAEAIESDIAALRTTLSRRAAFTGLLAVLMLWMGMSFAGIVPVPKFMDFDANPLVFAGIYTAMMLGAILINFTTVATGIVGLFGAPTVDSAPAVAAVGGLVQAGILVVQLVLKTPATGTLFGCVAALILAFNAYGKRVRATAILRNFQLASSAGVHHSAAYILDSSTELTYNITKGLEEEDPALLVSRPTGLVKGFLRQSFSQRGTDRTGKLLGWLVLGASLLAAVLTYLLIDQNIFTAISALAAVVCIAAPLSSSLVSGVPSSILQKSTARVGAVVPGWSAIEDLGNVNVVMAGARDIFPPSVVSLRGIKTFEKERVDIAILYAASVLIEGCDTLRDIFLGVIQGKKEMLYKVESLTREPGRGFTAWVQNNRVVIGSREMLQRHDIAPPPMEIEVKHVPEGHMPIYLAVSGRLFAMFIVGYGGNAEVRETLNGLVKSGVSLLITSDDMNVTNELIEHAYNLPKGVVKVLGRRELDILEPLTSYMPESEGVMTHIGTFSSFIGGMRSAAGCAASERMSSIVQTASVILACALGMLLVFGGGLANLSIAVALVYQLGWTLLVGILPFMRRY